MNMTEAICFALVRILDNQIKIKNHLGIIKELNKHTDDEYAYDKRAIERLEMAVDD